ncbi:fasciclin domain-containing protein [Pontivivens ytuae]|uniref:Fasciclin domain-containing protein n=1 Tax=Pontivivens ytuae TaxID=2789856 RepID=A0A7S9LW46_9RHOB|nr:fasciclin domain-containing protein [Pontivivens ytuae]QPH56065.1 fasciclin domain-containing protein [Pontivivens ytuae]
MFKTLTAATALALATPAFAQEADIVATAEAAGTFETLLAAASAAGLVETLQGEGPFTVFAPTDAAFAALPEGTVETLLMPENREDLVQVLSNHVVPGMIMSADIAGQETEITALGGNPLEIDATDGVTVNTASVVQADVQASNGVIHVVDAVIIPGEPGE